MSSEFYFELIMRNYNPSVSRADSKRDDVGGFPHGADFPDGENVSYADKKGTPRGNVRETMWRTPHQSPDGDSFPSRGSLESGADKRGTLGGVVPYNTREAIGGGKSGRLKRAVEGLLSFFKLGKKTA